MSRWKAAGIHLCISIAIGIAVTVLLFGLWYPPPYFHAEGGEELIVLLVGVDLVLGPLLTLIVFRAEKRGLKFDLAFIGLVQSAALVYGLSIVLQSRPIFLVGVLDRFVLVAASEITDADLAQGSAVHFRTRSWTGPVLVGAELPTDAKERNDLAFSTVSGRDVPNLPKYYCDFTKAAPDLLRKAKPVEALNKSTEYQSIVQWMSASKHDPASVRWLPVKASKADMIMLIDSKTAQPLKAFAVDPWQ